jgi:hypothetical protein
MPAGITAMAKSVVKTFKFSRDTTKRLRALARTRKVAEAEIIRAGLEREMTAGTVDMRAAIGTDFGCVASGDSRTVKEKLADFGR